MSILGNILLQGLFDHFLQNHCYLHFEGYFRIDLRKKKKSKSLPVCFPSLFFLSFSPFPILAPRGGFDLTVSAGYGGRDGLGTVSTPSSPTSRLLMEYEMHLRNTLAKGMDAESYSLHTFEALLTQSMENLGKSTNFKLLKKYASFV